MKIRLFALAWTMMITVCYSQHEQVLLEAWKIVRTTLIEEIEKAIDNFDADSINTKEDNCKYIYTAWQLYTLEAKLTVFYEHIFLVYKHNHPFSFIQSKEKATTFIEKTKILKNFWQNKVIMRSLNISAL